MDDQEKQAQEKALALRAQVDSIQVIDQASYDFAEEVNRKAVMEKKAFHVWFDPIDRKSLDARQELVAGRKKIDEPLDYVIEVTGSRAAKWKDEEKRKAEKLRQEAEAKALKEAEDRQLEQAQLLSDLGMDEAAEEALVAAPVIEKVKVAEPVKAEGTSVRTYYSAKVDSLKDLVVAVATGLAPIQAIEANMTYLNGRATLEKDGFSLPGVSVVKEVKQSRRL